MKPVLFLESQVESVSIGKRKGVFYSLFFWEKGSAIRN
jgi:hypothetical protein